MSDSNTSKQIYSDRFGLVNTVGLSGIVYDLKEYANKTIKDDKILNKINDTDDFELF